jgi:hypothetical protein
LEVYVDVGREPAGGMLGELAALRVREEMAAFLDDLLEVQLRLESLRVLLALDPNADTPAVPVSSDASWIIAHVLAAADT